MCVTQILNILINNKKENRTKYWCECGKIRDQNKPQPTSPH